METDSSNIFIPQDWANAVNTIIDTSCPPITLICGAKNSGKTTLSRHLLNIFLQRHKKAAYLDTDVGQTVFTPPGFLSLTVIDKITPDLMVPCLKTPDMCYFFGDISSKRDPNMYLKYIFALYDYYRKVYCAVSNDDNHNIGVPLVVNTPGWVKGIGYDLLVDILKYICPTHVVKICISAESKNLPSGAFWSDEGHDPEVTLIEVNSARQDSLQRSVLVQTDAHLLRELRIMAYFRQCFPNDSPMNTIKELAVALATHPPYEISLSDIKIKYLHCQIPNAESFYNLNATIVGLAVSNDVAEQLPQCVGLGIVRSIDTSRRLLYIITPVSPNILEKVDLLLQGLIQIPTCLLQVGGCISPYMSANVLPID